MIANKPEFALNISLLVDISFIEVFALLNAPVGRCSIDGHYATRPRELFSRLSRDAFNFTHSLSNKVDVIYATPD